MLRVGGRDSSQADLSLAHELSPMSTPSKPSSKLPPTTALLHNHRLRFLTLAACAIIFISTTFVLLAPYELSRSTLSYLHLGASESPDMIAWSNRPRVSLPQGTYVGTDVQGIFPQVIECFLGIPYAESTAGTKGRWREARIIRGRAQTLARAAAGKESGEAVDDEAGLNLDLEARQMAFDAGSYGHRCPSTANANDTVVINTEEGEDCLNVNIFRPKSSFTTTNAETNGSASTPVLESSGVSATLLPVVVYFHGGGFNFGTSSTRAIRSMVAWAAEPMIGVTFNYRTGAFGFLSSSLAAKEGALNLGLKDQLVLLQWVKENIAAFGGDPEKVTLMGTSAGAHSVGHLLTYKLDEPRLFRAAIVESGGAMARAVYSPTNPLHEQQFQEFLAALDASSIPDDEVLDHLRTLPFSTIKRASEKVFNNYNTTVRWAFQPVIDGAGGVIATAPSEAWAAGKFHRVPILTGYNTNEGAMFTPRGIDDSDFFTEFFRTLIPRLTDDDITELNMLYPDPLTNINSPYKESGPESAELGKQFKRIEAAYSHFAYIGPVRQTAYFASMAAASSPSSDSLPHQPVYLYHFGVNKTIHLGANHGDHSPFPTYNRGIWKFSATQRAITRAMHAYWTSFIISGGDPNQIPGRDPSRPRWEPYEIATRDDADTDDADGKAGLKLLDPALGKVMQFGMGNDERVGGSSLGVVAEVVNDDWARRECGFWWSKKGLSEN